MGIAATYKLEPMMHGDTWRGIAQIGPLLINALPPADALTSARMQFRKIPGGPLLGHEISTTDGGITIVNDTTWILEIPAQPLPLPPGVWHWDIETVNAIGRIRKYLQGTIQILQATTI